MNSEQQKDLITRRVKIIHFNDTWWITANPIAEALEYRDSTKFVKSHVLPKNLKSYKDIKTDNKFSFELHPTTKFINKEGLGILLNAKNQTTLLNWIENEFVPGPKATKVSVGLIVTPSTRSYEEIFGDVVKLYIDETLWMLANPFVDALGYINCHKALKENVSSTNQMIKTANRSIYINEAGAHELINSKIPGVADFKKWVIETLLPRLRCDDVPLASPAVCYTELINEIIKIEVNGVWWMLAKPIAVGLGYSNSNQAILDHTSPKNQMEYEKIKSLGFCVGDGTPVSKKPIKKNSKFINEAGIFELIGKSNKNKAKLFQKWIYNDLLPTLRRESRYHMSDAPPMVQQQMTSISSILTPKKINTTTPMQVDDNTNELSIVAPPTVRYDELINEIFKVYVNGVWWMLANPFARGLGYIYPPDAIRSIVSEENQMEYDVIKSRVKQMGESSTKRSANNIQAKSKFINEAGLFELIGKSDKDKAEDFKKWVYNDLLPTLRSDSEYNIRNAPPMVQQQMEAISSVVDGNQFEFLKREMQEQRMEMQEQRSQIGTLVASLNQLVNYSQRQNEIIETQRNIIETSLAEHKLLMEQYQTTNENAIARQETAVAQQFSVVNSALAHQETVVAQLNDGLVRQEAVVAQQFCVINNSLAHQETAVAQQISTVNALVHTALTKQKIEFTEQLSNLQPLISAEPNDRNKFQCLEIYYKGLICGDRIMYWYHALRTQKCSLEAARLAIQPGFLLFYYTDSANAVNAYNSIKDRITYNVALSRGNKIYCKHDPTEFMRAINGEFFTLRQPPITEFF
jgi:prophage antirepressor-like protein